MKKNCTKRSALDINKKSCYSCSPLVTPVVLRLDGGFANEVDQGDLPSNMKFVSYAYVLLAIVYGDGIHCVTITKCKQMDDIALFYSDGCVGQF
jgi:hypothetical protein